MLWGCLTATAATYVISNCTDDYDSDMTRRRLEQVAVADDVSMWGCRSRDDTWPDPISVLIMASCNIRPALCWYTCQSVEDDTRVNKDIAIAMELSEAHTIYEVIRYNVMLNGRKHTELHIIPNWTVRISEVAVLSDGMVQGRGCGSGGMVQSSVLSTSGHPALPRPAHSSEGNYNCVLTWWLELANMWQRWPTLVSDNTSAVVDTEIWECVHLAESSINLDEGSYFMFVCRIVGR